MSRTVQPYVDWLSLPPSDRPPNHFELLGLEVTEQNEVKIRGAYYRRVARVSMHQHGADADLCQEVLDQLASARDVLLDAQKRHAYLATLHTDVPKVPAATAKTKETISVRTKAPAAAFRSAPKSAQKVTPSAVTLSAGEVERLLNAKRADDSLDRSGQSRSRENRRKPNRLNRPFGMFSIMRSPAELFEEVVRKRGLTPYQAERFVAEECDELIIGPYIIEAEVADGSWGNVYQAIEIRGDESVGLRQLRSTMTTHVPKLRRLSQKIQQLRSEYIQTVHHCGIYNDRPFIATEWVDGEPLSTLIQRDGPFSAYQAIYVIDQVAKGLKSAQEISISHGELRPSKVLVCRDGRVVIRDLALAEVIVENKSLIKQPQKLIQITPPHHLHYYAPESLLGEVKLRAQADIYSLGCILWFCLTGKTLHEETEPLRVLVAHRERAVPSVVKHDKSLPVDFDRVLTRMLCKEPSERFQSYAELRSELLHVYKQLPPINAKPSSLWTQVLATRPISAGHPLEGVSRFHRGRILLDGLCLATLGVLLTAGGVWASRTSSEVQPVIPMEESHASEPEKPTILQSNPSSDIPTIQAEDAFLIPD